MGKHQENRINLLTSRPTDDYLHSCMFKQQVSMWLDIQRVSAAT